MKGIGGEIEMQGRCKFKYLLHEMDRRLAESSVNERMNVVAAKFQISAKETCSAS
jgi:hypothetical protein